MRVIVFYLSNQALTANQSMLRSRRMSRAIRTVLTSFHPTAGAGLMARLMGG